MARECFCGCGRTLSRSDARLNRAGTRQIELLAGLRDEVIPTFRIGAERLGGPANEIAEMVAQFTDVWRDGDEMLSQLILIAHNELDVRAIDRRHFRAWQRMAYKLRKRARSDADSWQQAKRAAVATAQLAVWARHNGLDPDEALAAVDSSAERGLAQGSHDAYAAVWLAVFDGKPLPY